MRHFRRVLFLTGIDLIAVAALGGLLALHVTYVGLGFLARHYVIAVGDYALSKFPEPGMLEKAMAISSAAFEDDMPTFRRHRPEVNIASRRLKITVLVRGGTSIRLVFESIEQRLSDVLRAGQTDESDRPVSLIDIQLTPYPWIRPLDVLVAFVLAGAFIGWFVFPIERNRAGIP
jgi:hypothetical protein